ncbi:MAG: NADH-quinone oxidoreductase subunit D [Chloroflexales bacterium]
MSPYCYTLTLEPAAAAWRGPQQLVLKVAGERITDVEYRPDLAPRQHTAHTSPLLQEVAHSCSTCTHAHCLAFSLAVEALLSLEIPLRATRLRLVAAELERATSHLGTLDALFSTMGLDATATPLAKLRNSCAQWLALLVGAPDGSTFILPGGLRRDLSETRRSELITLIAGASQRLYQIVDRVIDQRLILARTVNVGILTSTAASQFRLRGPLARASGLKDDVRVDAPYGAYAALAPQVITQEGGDVYARIMLLLLETLESLKLSDRALDDLPAGTLSAQVPAALPVGVGEATVEAPRGALRYRVESDGKRISGYRVEPAPQLDRLLARTLLGQANLDDAVLIALSSDPCSACQRAGSDE